MLPAHAMSAVCTNPPPPQRHHLADEAWLILRTLLLISGFARPDLLHTSGRHRPVACLLQLLLLQARRQGRQHAHSMRFCIRAGVVIRFHLSHPVVLSGRRWRAGGTRIWCAFGWRGGAPPSPAPSATSRRSPPRTPSTRCAPCATDLMLFVTGAQLCSRAQMQQISEYSVHSSL